ncbi:hypothetical protein [Acetobacter fallax]|uniref:Uncharacterized protein n=1 Tax=Acetobacter fallax TaxID=1737473 RepID=A0ABX0KCH4_9PROT|nr:hypothetical protein [Acetobacter fallax]NHO33387.1 hypothetical protein [Acetobacter fallax]NHO37006.1 hypothetical protein [Acetobacter fallax]
MAGSVETETETKIICALILEHGTDAAHVAARRLEAAHGAGQIEEAERWLATYRLLTRPRHVIPGPFPSAPERGAPNTRGFRHVAPGKSSSSRETIVLPGR